MANYGPRQRIGVGSVGIVLEKNAAPSLGFISDPKHLLYTYLNVNHLPLASRWPRSELNRVSLSILPFGTLNPRARACVTKIAVKKLRWTKWSWLLLAGRSDVVRSESVVRMIYLFQKFNQDMCILSCSIKNTAVYYVHVLIILSYLAARILKERILEKVISYKSFTM